MTTLLKFRRYDIPMLFISAILLVVGTLMLWGSWTLGSSWYNAPLPQVQTFQPYITANAEVAPAIDFSPGLPKMQISFDDFVKRSNGKPYLVTFWSGWKTGDPWYSRNLSTYKVVYSVLVTGPTGERHLYATQDIPEYSNAYAPGYSTATAFDPKTNGFYLAVTGTHYGLLAWSVILLLLGGFVFCGGIGMSVELGSELKTRAT